MDKERLERLEKEYHDWIEMHDGMVPSEDLTEFEQDESDRWWLIQQAKRAEEQQKEIARLESFRKEFYKLSAYCADKNKNIDYLLNENGRLRDVEKAYEALKKAL